MEIILKSITILSLAIAVISLYLGMQSAQQLKRSEKLIARISELVRSSQRLGVTMVYRSRNAALEDRWTSYIRRESNVRILGTSLRGLLSGCPEISSVISENPKKFSFVLAHPDIADEIAKDEERLPGTILPDIIYTLDSLLLWGVDLKQIKLFKGHTRNFVIITDSKMLINPSTYGTEAFRFFCLECERSHPDDIYHQYLANHFQNVWNSTLAIPFTEAELEEWKKRVSSVGSST